MNGFIGIAELMRPRAIMLTAAMMTTMLCAPAMAWGAEPEVAQLTVDPDPAQGFGGAVASAGDIVVVGDGSADKVYVYERPAGGWSGTPAPIATFFRPELQPGSRFGESVAISADGSLIVVGAPGADVNGTNPLTNPSNLNTGAVYAYERPAGGWTGNPEPYKPPGHPNPFINYFWDQPQIALVHNGVHQGLRVLAAPDGSWFASVSTRVYDPLLGFQSGGPLVIAVFYVPPPFGHMHLPSCRLIGTTIPPQGFGSLATNDDGTTIFAGDPAQWSIGIGEVLAWNMPSGGWDCFVQQPDARLTSSLTWGQPGRVGSSLAASGDWVVAGAPRATVGATSQAGKVFVWKKPAEGWVSYIGPPVGDVFMGAPLPGIKSVATLTAPDPAATARFGQSVAIFADAIGVAAPGATVGANTSQGKAYIFREPSGGWSGDINDDVIQFAASDGAANDDLGSFFSDPDGLSIEAGQELTLSSSALVASAPEQGKPTYVFEYKPLVSVALSGSGTGTVSGGAISCAPTCSSHEWLGDTVNLTASPSPGSSFEGWSEACTGSGACSILVDGPEWVTATFEATSAGACGATPVMGCANNAPGKSQLVIQTNVDPTKEKVQFTWQKGSFPFTDFGDPTASTDYTLCVYDANGAVVGLTAPAGTGLCGRKPCWSVTGRTPSGIKYKDGQKPQPVNDGVKGIAGKASTSGKAKLQVKAQGSTVPTINMTSALVYPVTAQVVTTNAACWQADFTLGDEKKNNGIAFKAVHKAP